MADFNAIVRPPSRSQGTEQREFVGKNTSAETVAQMSMGAVTRPTWIGMSLATTPATVTNYINRGTNSGSGQTHVYWLSPKGLDTIGAYYDGPVPFGQLVDKIVVGSFV